MEKKTLKIPEVAEQLGISLPVAYELAKRPGFPAITLGRRIIVVKELFDEWLIREAGGRAEDAGR